MSQNRILLAILSGLLLAGSAAADDPFQKKKYERPIYITDKLESTLIKFIKQTMPTGCELLFAKDQSGFLICGFRTESNRLVVVTSKIEDAKISADELIGSKQSKLNLAGEYWIKFVNKKKSKPATSAQENSKPKKPPVQDAANSTKKPNGNSLKAGLIFLPNAKKLPNRVLVRLVYKTEKIVFEVPWEDRSKLKEKD